MTSIPLDLLDGTLFEAPVPEDTRRAILSRMFSLNISRKEYQAKAQGWDAYFNHWYEDQCQSGERGVSVSTHREVLDIISWLKNGEDRATIKEKCDLLTSSAHDGDGDNDENGVLIEGSINLATRLWLQLPIGDVKRSLTAGRSISWRNGSLANNLYGPGGTLRRDRATPLDPIKVPRSFNALNIEQIGGIQICWTSNLHDHLRMKDDDTKLSIFHHVSFLELHLESDSDLLNDELIHEVFESLAMLLPSSNNKCNAWFRTKLNRLGLDPKAGACEYRFNRGSWDINEFRYFRDRLIILKQVFDASEPRTISQWWLDDRKKVQWYTFWIAALVLVLTIVFGMIQSVTGIVQAWASVRSLSHDL